MSPSTSEKTNAIKSSTSQRAQSDSDSSGSEDDSDVDLQDLLSNAPIKVRSDIQGLGAFHNLSNADMVRAERMARFFEKQWPVSVSLPSFIASSCGQGLDKLTCHPSYPRSTNSQDTETLDRLNLNALIDQIIKSRILHEQSNRLTIIEVKLEGLSSKRLLDDESISDLASTSKRIKRISSSGAADIESSPLDSTNEIKGKEKEENGNEKSEGAEVPEVAETGKKGKKGKDKKAKKEKKEIFNKEQTVCSVSLVVVECTVSDPSRSVTGEMSSPNRYRFLFAFDLSLLIFEHFNSRHRLGQYAPFYLYQVSLRPDLVR